MLLAYHDRSDGGLFATLCEMAFAGHCGVSVNVDMLTIDPACIRLGRLQDQAGAGGDPARGTRPAGAVQRGDRRGGAGGPQPTATGCWGCCASTACRRIRTSLGAPNDRDVVEIHSDARCIFSMPRAALLQAWSETSQRIARLRDDPECGGRGGRACCRRMPRHAAPLSVSLSFDASSMRLHPRTRPRRRRHRRRRRCVASGARPRVAVLREQGVNSQREMAAAFDLAGFDADDVHMSDLMAGRHRLQDFQVLVACGGFSYGDVLGAGVGWAKSVLFNARLAEAFSLFFNRPDTLSLGVCNGCQMMSQLKSLIPGASAWPRFVRNRSQQYEARFAQVEVMPSPSLLLAGMAGSRLPIAVAHGEGRVRVRTAAGAGLLRAGGRAGGDALRRRQRRSRPNAIRSIRTARPAASPASAATMAARPS